MKYRHTSAHQSVGFDLNIATRSLDIVVAFSAVIFVLNFAFEVLQSYGASFSHRALMLGFIATLGFWAFIECLLLMKGQAKQVFKILLALLAMQVVLSMTRAGWLYVDLHTTSSSQLLLGIPHNKWHLLFLIPYIFVFLGIHKTVVGLFSLNERIFAANKEKQMLIALNAMAMARDNETGNHILRTQIYARTLAQRLREMGYHSDVLTDDFIDLMVKAAPLHDIGKVGVPDAILHKKGALTPDEWVIMKTHTTIGESILTAAVNKMGRSDDVLDKAIMIAGGHHERWDGSGYPRGLKGEAIPLAARIMTVADIYDALVSRRVYKASWTHEEAVAEIGKISGAQLDPHVAMAFEYEAAQFQRIAMELTDDGSVRPLSAAIVVESSLT